MKNIKLKINIKNIPKGFKRERERERVKNIYILVSEKCENLWKFSISIVFDL